jgi:hypothetical protein
MNRKVAPCDCGTALGRDVAGLLKKLHLLRQTAEKLKMLQGSGQRSPGSYPTVRYMAKTSRPEPIVVWIGVKLLQIVEKLGIRLLKVSKVGTVSFHVSLCGCCHTSIKKRVTTTATGPSGLLKTTHNLRCAQLSRSNSCCSWSC